MAIEQTMSGRDAQARIDREALNFTDMIRDEHWTLEYAHQRLRNDNGRLNLFQMAGLAKAIACFQCSEVQ